MFSHKICGKRSPLNKGWQGCTLACTRKLRESSDAPTHEPTFVPWNDNRKQETDCVTTVEWFIVFAMVYLPGHKGITLPGNDTAVEKSKAKTCRFVESKNGLSLSQIVTFLLSVSVGCRWIRKRLSPHFWPMSAVAKAPWKASCMCTYYRLISRPWHISLLAI